ncbi:MAG: LarC family nickel insertion protein [Anaerolineae bacterium]
MGKIVYFDCIAGASGDMILGALVDAGLPISDLRERLGALHLAGFDLQSHRVFKNAFAATKVDVIVSDSVPERRLGDILDIVAQSDLPGEIKDRAMAIFRKIGSAEADIHGTSLEEVHLHELGGVDTIVDVVGALVGLDALGVDRVVSSPIPLGRGFIHGAHGRIPLPAPATVALLKGVPVVGSPMEVETVTPTGAALLGSLADDFGPIPSMNIEMVGYGAGTRDLPVPNVIRLLIGTELERPVSSHRHPHTHSHDETSHRHSHSSSHEQGSSSHRHPHPHNEHTISASHHHAPVRNEANAHHNHEAPPPHEHHHPHEHAGPSDHTQEDVAHTLDSERREIAHRAHSHSDTHSCLDTATLRVLETNIDDLNPEFYEYVMDRLFAAGALDVFLSPIQMKKNRPATLLRVLCQPDDVEAMTTILFEETSTLGIREQTVNRHALPRSVKHIDTPYGSVHVKVAQLSNGEIRAAPEYEDCRRLAHAENVPLREVYQAAQEAARRTFSE